MKKNISNSLYFILMLCIVMGCSSRKSVVEIAPEAHVANTAKPAFSYSGTLSSITAKQVSYQTLAIKSKASLDINNNNNDVSMNIRIKNGEAVWVSVTALAGIEVARALITPDSIKVINRLQSEYIKKPFSFIYQFANKSIDFAAVQGLFTANAFSGTLSEKAVFDVTDQQTRIKGNLSDLLYALVFNQTYNLVQNNINDLSKGEAFSVSYENFQPVSGREIPYLVNISSSAANRKLTIALKYTSVEVNPVLDFAFNPPKRFTVKN